MIKLKLLFEDSDQHIGGNGAPDLCLCRVFARAQKALDAQMAERVTNCYDLVDVVY